MTRIEFVRRMSAVLVVVAVSSNATALERNETVVNSTPKHTSSPKARLSAPWDRLDSDAAAQEWKITTLEWQRYQALMGGQARYFATEMPPLMVLAMYAESEPERDRFSEKLAQFERDKVDRLLKVQRAYDAAMKRLYPNEKIIDLDLLRQQGLQPASQSVSAIPGHDPMAADVRIPRFGDRLALFVSRECNACAEKVRVLATRYSIAPLEVYFLGDSSAFKHWIKGSNLEPDWLKQHGVTFAQDEGQAQQFEAAPGSAFIVRGTSLYEMSL